MLLSKIKQQNSKLVKRKWSHSVLGNNYAGAIADERAKLNTGGGGNIKKV